MDDSQLKDLKSIDDLISKSDEKNLLNPTSTSLYNLGSMTSIPLDP